MSQGRELDKATATLGLATPPPPSLSSHTGEGRGQRAFDSSPKTALGLPPGVKGLITRVEGGEGCSEAPWTSNSSLAKLFDELSANEFETDNEVPFRDTWAEKNEGKSAPGKAHLETFFFLPLNPKHTRKTNPPVYTGCQRQTDTP